MSLKDVTEMSPRSLINPKSISAAIEYFFGRGELSQVVDQTNPLSMLTHERRLSALGPGGLNRKRAGFEVRDVHISHYGRICPIETPEGTNIGLISSLAIYSGVDSYGFLVTPYRKISRSKLTDDVVWLRADEEHDAYLAPADALVVDNKLEGDSIIARYRGDFVLVPAADIQYIDVAPSQMVGVSAGLIPFLEHDDANRALMGSNMQRQAVPLLVTEPPIVATGMERDVAANSGLIVRAVRKGTVSYVDAERIEVTAASGPVETHRLRKYVGLNERTCQNQKPIVKLGQKVDKGEVIADGAAIYRGELALGRNVLVGFMAWDGFNFEDAIIISEELVENDVYTSIHIEEYDIEIRDTKLGREEFTRDIPNVGERALHNLDENGIVRIGTYVRPGDILVGKVSPKSKTELTPEEKLLHAIFGRAGEDVKNDSLEVPSGVEGIVIATEKFSRQMSLSEDERREFQKQLKDAEAEGNARIAELFGALVGEIEKQLQRPLTAPDGSPLVRDQEHKVVVERALAFKLDDLDIRSPQRKVEIEKSYKALWPAVEEAIDAREGRLNSMKRGDELRPGVLQMVKVYVAAKRVISVGDKMAGRHGNKGVIAKILPKEDMPFLADGTPVQILLNPLGVPSRMNVGQILETHLGWASSLLGFQAVTPVFDGANEQDINEMLDAASLPRHGKAQLFDGRTGEPLEQETTVGYIYMLKLHHLVDDKVHARSTGPYSLITQQPLGGKARFGGQRFGEMEVWALEAYGAAYILQELLTVKSDDVEGRTKIYESMVKGENTLEAGTPASFDVLTNEIRGLALNMSLEKRRV
jgi:DNA-directed RNA polymerase subunit beta